MVHRQEPRVCDQVSIMMVQEPGERVGVAPDVHSVRIARLDVSTRTDVGTDARRMIHRRASSPLPLYPSPAWLLKALLA